MPSLTLWWYLLSRAALSILAPYSLVPRVSPKQNDIGQKGEVGHLAYPAESRWGSLRGAPAGPAGGGRGGDVT